MMFKKDLVSRESEIEIGTCSHRVRQLEMVCMKA